MGKLFTNKRGLKRSKSAGQVKHAEKRTKIIQNLSPTSAGDLSSEEEEISAGQFTFDSLLKKLGSNNEKKAKGRTIKLETESDSGEYEDGDGDSESEDTSDEENSGLGSESDPEEGDLTERHPSNIVGQGEEDVTEDEGETFVEDDVDSYESDSQTNIDETSWSSSFHRHLGHILTNENANQLTSSKWKYKWEMPAKDKLMSKWVGTGDHLAEEGCSAVICDIKPKLLKHWLDIYKASSFTDLNSQMRFFFSLCNSYRDIMHCNKKPFYMKGEEDSVVVDSYLMHALNHVLKTRDLVNKNSAKLSREQENDANHTKKNEGKGEDLNCGNFLDQGFTRPKVMFLLPLRSIALRIMKRLIQLTPASNKTKVEYIDRFSKEFGNGNAEEDDENLKSQRPEKRKPKDFQRLFGGNNNDHFMIGIKFTKRCIKLYSDFYSSDIIVASPLGLVTKIGDAKEKDVDYLSSIEVLIIDHADVIAMQNWSHMNTVVKQLNCKPYKQHGTDIMRIRQWYLEGHARSYRQTILLGSFLNPDMNALFSRSCINFEGKVKLISKYKGVLPKVLLQVRQLYERFDASSIIDVDDARFEHFCKKVFPKMKDSLEGGTMLFISSYFEFVRVRNFLKSQNASFCLLGEYTKQNKISGRRLQFFEGKQKIMLYTERFHFYYRYKIRGLKNLFFYSLPEREDFYPEVINMLEGSNNMMCTVLFSQFDHLRLERIVGTSATKRMLSSDKKMFVFC